MNIYFELFKVFLKIGAFTFGGGYAMIPLIEEEIVVNKGWVKKEDIFDYFAVSQSFPGAIAINTSTLVGYKVAGKLGAICATFGVILPSFVIITLIATFFSSVADSSTVKAVFTGINGAVIVLILLAALKMLKIAIHDALSVIIVIITVVVILFTDISPIFLIIGGALIGFLLYIYHHHLKGGDDDIS
jgi:chromate transporter